MESSSWIDSSLSLSLNLNPPNFKIKSLADDMMEELKRVRMENKKLTEMLTTMYENYTALQTQVAELMNKRKSPESGGDGVQTDQSSSSSDDEVNVFKKPRNCGIVAGVISRKPSSRILVRTDKTDNSLIVKDGYQWRKYGQKVTRDNPCPRAYFKCSFAPSCQVKKKVQRSIEDQTMLVATYDGEHNHPLPTEIDSMSNCNSSVSSATANLISSGAVIQSKPPVTLDLITPVEENRLNRTSSRALEGQNQNRSVFQQFIVEQMASSLTNDPSFKAAVAASISGRMMDSNNGMVGKWL